MNSDKEYENMITKIEKLKGAEKNLKLEIKQQEEEIEKLFEECEEEIEETLNEIMQHKKVNINMIRKSSRNAEKIKETLKNNIFNN